MEELLPLSPMQEGLLFHEVHSEGEHDTYTMQTVLDMSGVLDDERMRAAARALIRRHAVLRSAFLHEGLRQPVQVVHRDPVLRWTDVDLRHLDGDDQAKAVEQALLSERCTRFDLTAAPLLRFLLVRLDDERYRFVITNHHIVLDGWSMPVLLRELSALYLGADPVSGLPAVRGYRDYLSWLAGRDRGAARAAWGSALVDLPGASLVAGGSGDAAAVVPEQAEFALDAELAAGVAAGARALGVTVNTLVQVAWGVVVGRLLGRSDVVFGATVSGRPAELSGVEQMVGLFINTVPVRVRWRGGESLRDVVARVRDEQVGLLEHHYLGLAEIQQQAGAGNLFDTLLVYENYPLEPPGVPAGSPQDVRITAVRSRAVSHYAATLLAFPRAGGLRFRLDYRPDRIDPAAARSITERFVAVLRALVAAPDRPVSRLDVLTGRERTDVLTWAGSTATSVDCRSLVELFQRQVAASPD
ncbi:condensation domain-containing protein, partial [Paractinoplanes rishiriensis]|uniref:condensation domain-containing protein n=1 Tax=Paractinoplanes rishiriensis TaxID=1050105 RepID=UPI001EF2AEFF